MKARQQRQDRRTAGTALCAVLVVIMVISATAGIMGSISQHRSRKASRLADKARAESIAEAGARYAYSILATNFLALTANGGYTTSSDFEGGAFTVQASLVTNDVAVIHSKSTYREASAEVMLDIGNEELADRDDIFPPSEAFNCNIVAEGTISWTGTAVFGGNGGRVHCNDLFKQSGSGKLNADVYSCVSIALSGNAGYIDGDAWAPKVSGKTQKIYGVIHSGPVRRMLLPELDLTPYFYHAASNGEVYDKSVTLSQAYQPQGGVMWVNGDLVLTSSDDMYGCFIATGDIKCKGSGGILKIEDYPALVSKHGAIYLAGSGSYHGLVYALIGDVIFSGGGGLNGTIFCGGNFVKTGGQTTFLHDASLRLPPFGTPAPQDNTVYLKAWQK